MATRTNAITCRPAVLTRNGQFLGSEEPVSSDLMAMKPSKRTLAGALAEGHHNLFPTATPKQGSNVAGAAQHMLKTKIKLVL